MSGIGDRAVILTLSRLANYGLMIVSPVVLVRLLSLEDFGRYREFLLYGSILQGIAMFSINDTLLYFVPAHPQSPWRIARQTAVLIACSSVLATAGLALIELCTGGALVHGWLLPLSAYTLLSVNLDFWEFFWLAQGRPAAVFLYSGGRLLARMLVAVTAAALTHRVGVIVWSLVALEGLRLLGCAVALLTLDRGGREPPVAGLWREQLRFGVSSGLASQLAMLNRTLSNLVVVKVLGAAALAQYSIGRYGEPVALALRNSISCVVLPEMVRAERHDRVSPLIVWRRATVVNALLLFPVAVVVARFAEPLIASVFGPQYRPGALVMQLYMLVVIRECFDFAPALRAINRTRPLVVSNVLSLCIGALALVVWVPKAGIAGAMGAFVVAALVDGIYLGVSVLRLYRLSVAQLLPWDSIGRTALAALAAAVVLAGSFWTRELGLAGIALAALAYLAAFSALVLALRVPEALALRDWSLRRVLLRAGTARS